MSEVSVFSRLNSINVNDHTEKKNGLTYLSWAWAWAEVKKLYPDAAYTIYERNTEYGPVNYFTDGRTCWVKTGVTINGLEHIEELPVMDFKNRSIGYDAVNSMDVNKAIQRSLTKACARHGLGLYIYAGEDLPEGDEEKPAKPEPYKPAKPEPYKPAYDAKAAIKAFCNAHKIPIKDFVAYYDACVEMRLVPRISSDSMTKEQCDALLNAVEKNFAVPAEDAAV